MNSSQPVTASRDETAHCRGCQTPCSILKEQSSHNSVFKLAELGTLTDIHQGLCAARATVADAGQYQRHAHFKARSRAFKHASIMMSYLAFRVQFVLSILRGNHYSQSAYLWGWPKQCLPSM